MPNKNITPPEKVLHIDLELIINKDYNINEFVNAVNEVDFKKSFIVLEVDGNLSKYSLQGLYLDSVYEDVVEVSAYIPYKNTPDLMYCKELYVWFVLGGISYILESTEVITKIISN